MAVAGHSPKNLPVGMDKGRDLKQRTLPARPSQRKGKASKRHEFVKNIVKEVVGQSPYERRIMELLRNGQDKKARRMAKKRLGTLRRGKRKVDELTGIIAEQRRAGH